MQKAAILILASLFHFGIAFSDTLYVDQNANGANNGSNWTDAYLDLQDALSNAIIGDEIWVAQGTYYPTSTADRSATFQVSAGLKVFGGFAGTESSIDMRDWRANITTLSGDIGIPGDSTDNSYSVVSASNHIQAMRIDGFLIRDGKAESMQYGGGGFSGALSGSDTLIIANCIFYHNTSNRGGAIDFMSDNPVLVNCEFYGNHSGQYGGAITLSLGQLTMMNCVFAGNSAQYGGALYISTAGPTVPPREARLFNCTFHGNKASQGGGAITTSVREICTVYNSIFWGNTAGVGYPNIFEGGNGDTLYMVNSIVEGGYPGPNNMNSDPMFLDADGADNIAGTLDDGLQLSAGSPAIDAGDVTWVPNDSADIDYDGNTAENIPLDLAGQARIFGSDLDLGAYEYFVPASAVSPVAKNSFLNLFPQPSAGQFTLELKLAKALDLEMKMIDQKGKTVWKAHRKVAKGERQILIETNLPRGTYLLFVSGDGAAGLEKVVID